MNRKYADLNEDKIAEVALTVCAIAASAGFFAIAASLAVLR